MNNSKKVNFFNTGESRFTTFGYALSDGCTSNSCVPFSSGDLLFVCRNIDKQLSPNFVNIAMINEYYSSINNKFDATVTFASLLFWYYYCGNSSCD